MPKGFIKCTAATPKRETVYFQTSHISAVMQVNESSGNDKKFNYSVVYLDSAHDDCRFAVRETPEEIMQMIAEANS